MKGNQWGSVSEDMTLEEAYQGLAYDVCTQAVKDYRRALMADDKFMIRSLERFFLGEWFLFLTGGKLDGRTVIREVRSQWAKEKMSRRF